MPGRALRAVMIGGAIGGMIGGVLAGLAGCASGPPASLRVLQLNLCGSGIASCYTGRSTAAAAAVIRAEVPDLVTLNEICRDDLATLERALADVVDTAPVAAFQPAGDARTGAAYRCRAGGDYGIGVISRWPSAPGRVPDGGIYPAQDPDDPERRAWLCLETDAASAVAVCTTHLAYTVRAVARAQCAYLFGTVVARQGAPVVVGADLNLGPADSPDLRSCLPAGSVAADDGGQQHVVSTAGFTMAAVRTVDLGGATDHPGLLVTLAVR